MEGESAVSDRKQIEAERRRLEIESVGRQVLESKLFEAGKHQIHHGASTVALHTLEVADSALQITDALEKRGIRVDRKSVILGALCHDLGIIGRKEKFKNNLECCMRHPIDSVKAAEEIIPEEMDDHLRRIISRHMWPATPLPPTSREGWIVDLADTICAINDGVRPGHVRRPGFILRELEKNIRAESGK